MSLNLKLHDLVYVLGHGAGTVTMLYPDHSVDVSIAGYGTQHFSAEGKFGQSSVQRLFYHDPVVVLPCKNKRLWGFYKRMTRALYEEIAALEQYGELPEIPDDEDA